MRRLASWVKERDRVLVMGALNVTPDSFYDGGRYLTPTDAIERALQMGKEGADIIDVGGASSRPGVKPLSSIEELKRVMPVIEGVRNRSDVLLSVDTTRATVAKEAIACGASIVNDISALRFDPEIAGIIAGGGVFVVLMHMLGTPETMQDNPVYADPVEEIKSFLAERIETALHSGIPRERIIIDPGIGFGKRLEHNLTILRGLSSFTDLDVPVLIGLSRKSFLGEILNLPVGERLEGTIAANAVAVINGADIIRVHDVKEGRRTADVARRLRNDEP
ncbi:dihydropteroate synthase [Candidatus Bipolaricaulota bacterium]|nr:dihydropteroate synthase [Candidatus Bipolaricaulota bacterium]